MTESIPGELNVQRHIVHGHGTLPDWGLNIFYANARSILKPGKFDALKDILKTIKHEVHVILLTETWFKCDADAKTVNLDNYFNFYNFRGGAKGGGISIYVKKYLNPQLTAEKFREKVNYLWVYLEVYNINIGVIYKPELNIGELRSFLEVYSSQLRERPRAIVFGDYNIDLLKEISIRNYYLEAIGRASYTILNKIHDEYHTRRASGTIIDHACTNLDINGFEFDFSVIRSDILSDHNHLYLAIKGEGLPQTNASAARQMSTDELTRARAVQNGTATFDTVQLSDEDDDVLDTSDARAARPRKRRRIDIEYTCHICFLIHEDASSHLKHLQSDHQYSGSVAEKYVIRKCPHCLYIRLTHKEYNKHIREFHADCVSRIVPSTATTSAAPTNATASSNNATSRPTSSTRPVTTNATNVASSANATGSIKWPIIPTSVSK